MRGAALGRAIQIGIVGDYRPAFPPHPASTQAIHHAAKRLRLEARVDWIPTERLDDADADTLLESCDGIWLAAYSPYKSTTGAHRAIRFARERGRPFVAT